MSGVSRFFTPEYKARFEPATPTPTTTSNKRPNIFAQYAYQKKKAKPTPPPPSTSTSTKRKTKPKEDIDGTQRNDLWRHWYGIEKHSACVICRYMSVANDVPSGFHAAHVTARKNGGDNTVIWNRIPTCASCNRRAETRNLLEYVETEHASRSFYVLTKLREIYVQSKGPIPTGVRFVRDIIGCEVDDQIIDELDRKLDLMDSFEQEKFIKQAAINRNKAKQLKLQDEMRQLAHATDALEVENIQLELEIEQVSVRKNKMLSHR